MEFSGTIDALDSGSGWHIGERVLGTTLPMVTGRGAQSEYPVVPADSIVRVPHGVGLEQAATQPMNGLTARRAGPDRVVTRTDIDRDRRCRRGGRVCYPTGARRWTACDRHFLSVRRGAGTQSGTNGEWLAVSQRTVRAHDRAPTHQSP